MKTKGLIAGIVLLAGIVFMTMGNKTNLTGKIQDYSGVGILSGTLEVYKTGMDSRLVATVLTGLNGEYELHDLVPGNYKLVFKAEGFEDRVQFVNLSGRKKSLGIVKLTGNVIMLNPAVIYGKKA